MANSIMVQGTASNVGKSILTTALCRIFAEDGQQVAPFKSWNMSLNSYVTKDGGEIGRAQAVQAAAIGVEPVVEMQPLLIKPKGAGRVQVIANGAVVGDFGADRKNNEYLDWALNIIDESLTTLLDNFATVVLEGAGSPAEINIKEEDLANMKVAKLNDTPVLLVADVDRGGALADVVGTLQLLPAEERNLVQGIVLNKFRGDYELLKPGVEFLEEKTGLPVVGVLPYLKDINIPDEDSVALSNFAVSDPAIRIAVINLPHISNFTDFDQLRCEPEVEVKYVSSTDKLNGFDALIIPGTKNTMADLNYLHETGLATKINELAGQGVEIVGICGGYQILGSKLYDPELTEGQAQEQTGLDLLDVVTTFRSQKSTEQVRAEVQAQQGFFSQLTTREITGYEIHMGQTQLGPTAEPLFQLTFRSGEVVELLDGACNPEASVWGTYLHGIFANDQLRRDWINYLRAQKGLDPVKEELSRSEEELEADYQQLAQVVQENLDMELVYKIMREGQK